MWFEAGSLKAMAQAKRHSHIGAVRRGVPGRDVECHQAVRESTGNETSPRRRSGSCAWLELRSPLETRLHGSRLTCPKG